jgi:hypothetical protein
LESVATECSLVPSLALALLPVGDAVEFVSAAGPVALLDDDADSLSAAASLLSSSGGGGMSRTIVPMIMLLLLMMDVAVEETMQLPLLLLLKSWIAFYKNQTIRLNMLLRLLMTGREDID